MAKRKVNYAKYKIEEDMERVISKAAFMYRAALKYDLFVNKQLCDLSNEMGTIDVANRESVIELVRKMFHYCCGVILFYKLVFGKEIQDTDLRHNINKAFGKQSVSEFQNAHRFKFSYEKVNQLLGFMNKKDFNQQVSFIGMVSIKNNCEIEEGRWTELNLTTFDSIDTNNEAIKVFITDRLAHYYEKFDEMFNLLLPQMFGIQLDTNGCTEVSYDVESHATCTLTFPRNEQSVILTYNPIETFHETMRLTYADEESFTAFFNSIREGLNEVRCSGFPEMIGGNLNSAEQLYYFQEKRKRKISISSEDDTQQQSIDSIGAAQLSNTVTSTQVQQDAFPNLVNQQTTMEKYDTEKQGNEETGDNSAEMMAESTQSQRDEDIDTDVGYQNSSSSSTALSTTENEENILAYKQRVSEFITDAIIKEEKLTTAEIRQFIAFTITKRKEVDFVQVYLDIYKSVYDAGKKEFLKQDLTTKKPKQQKSHSTEMYYAKSEVDKKMDAYSKKIKRHLWAIANNQIEEFFQVLFRKEETLIKPLLASKKYIGKDATWNTKWDEVQRIKLQYNLEAYLKLAGRLQDCSFLLKGPRDDSAAKETLMKLFEKCIPFEWLRQIPPQSSSASSQQLQPPVPQINSKENENNDIDTKESTDAERPAETTIAETPRVLKTRHSAIPVVQVTKTWTGDRTPKRKNEMYFDETPSKASIVAEPIKKKKTNKSQRLFEESTFTPIKEKNIEGLLRPLADDVAELFSVGTNTSKLAWTQDVVQLIFDILTTEEDRATYLFGKRIWEFYLPTSNYPAEDRNISFLRAHFNIFQRMIVGSESSAPKSEKELIQEVFDDLIIDRKDFDLDQTRYDKYEKKVEALYARMIGDEDEEVYFSEEDLGFPFLCRHLTQLENLKFFVLDTATNTYKLKFLIFRGRLFYGPFRFQDIASKLSLSIFFSPSKTLNATNVDMDVVLEEWSLSVSEVEKNLDRIQSYIRTNALTLEDIEYLAGKFWDYVKDKQTVLDKSDIAPVSELTDTTKESMSSYVTTKSHPTAAFSKNLLKEKLERELDLLFRKKNMAKEEEAEFKEVVNKVFEELKDSLYV